jgi:hypothetical protein
LRKLDYFEESKENMKLADEILKTSTTTIYKV